MFIRWAGDFRPPYLTCLCGSSTIFCIVEEAKGHSRIHSVNCAECNAARIEIYNHLIKTLFSAIDERNEMVEKIKTAAEEVKPSALEIAKYNRSRYIDAMGKKVVYHGVSKIVLKELTQDEKEYLEVLGCKVEEVYSPMDIQTVYVITKKVDNENSK